MPRPPGAMDTSSVWEEKSWAQTLDTALTNVCDKHNQDQAKYDKSKVEPKLPEAEVVSQEIMKESYSEPIALANSGLVKGDVKTFTPELKQEFIEIVIENKMKLIEITDENITFEYNGNQFIIIPV